MVCCPSDPLQLSESQGNHYIWELSSVNRWDALKTQRLLWHWSAEGAQFLPRLCLTHVAQPVLHKLSELGYEVCLIHRTHLTFCQLTTSSSPDLLLIDYHFFKQLDNFLQGKHFHNQQEAEDAFHEFVESWSTDFYATGINLFLIGKNVLIVMVPILINKDVWPYL